MSNNHLHGEARHLGMRVLTSMELVASWVVRISLLTTREEGLNVHDLRKCYLRFRSRIKRALKQIWIFHSAWKNLKLENMEIES